MESEKQNYGTLQVRAVTARGALPVEGARIYISEDDPENGKTGVIFSGRTNSAGLSEKISLPAPPPENSEVPAEMTFAPNTTLRLSPTVLPRLFS